jgi:hypothetical protein
MGSDMKDLLKVLVLLALAIIGMLGCTRADGDSGLRNAQFKQKLTPDTFTTTNKDIVLLKVLNNDWLGLNGTLILKKPDHGEINITDDGFVYQPEAKFKGTDHFYYHYSSKAGSDSALVEIAVY